MTKKPRSRQSPERWKPRGYQKKAVQFLLEHAAAGLFLDPGLGKTSIVLAASKILMAEEMMSGALVLAPLRVAHSVWPGEVAEWADFNELDMVVLHGKDKERLANERHQFYVVNYEGLEWLYDSKLLRTLLRRGWIDTLIVDELSKLKNTNTKRHKYISPYLHLFARRWGLTGSPAANGLMDLFGQVYTLDLGRSFGPYVTRWRNKFFVPTGEFNWVPREGAEELIYEALRPLVLRMDADDYLTLPPLMQHIVHVDLPDKARLAYDELENDLITTLDDKTVAAINQAASSSKCRQVCSGAVYWDDVQDVPVFQEMARRVKREVLPVHTAKLDALADLVDELQGSQLLVAYEFKHELDRLLERWPNTPYIGAGVSTKRALQIEDDWNAGRIPLLFGQPQSMAHGLNFQKSSAHNICWFTTTWDYEMYDQFNRRLRRQGNKAPQINVYHLVARETVDQSVVVRLRGKHRTQALLFEALKERRTARLLNSAKKSRR